jgi:hypothetical protein
MNFVKLNVRGKKILVNLDLVTDIHTCPLGGCNLYLNITTSQKEQVCTHVDESLEEVESMLGRVIQ